MRITLIAALARNRTIGAGNSLPWHLSEDLRRFRRLTTGHVLVLGRKTFESIGSRPLIGRVLVVVSRNGIASQKNVEGAGSVGEALARAREIAEAGGCDEIFVAGGAEIYRQTLPVADRLQLTLIEEDFPGDAHFPEYDPAQWTLVEREDHGPTDEFPFPWSFQVLDRKA
ncbi:MAG TPA: dihydrofolate reductase [Thermoanaerobaculia bacterium]|jgi:dihydrofolate reductase|nr:dihydrofolate reductase [Thermoanaerobaculia bacterium]